MKATVQRGKFLFNENLEDYSFKCHTTNVVTLLCKQIKPKLYAWREGREFVLRKLDKLSLYVIRAVHRGPASL